MLEYDFGVPSHSWDEKLATHNGHFLQSTAWANFQIALGQQVLWTESDDWQGLGVIRKVGGVHIWYFPYGPALSPSINLPGILPTLKQIAKQHHIDIVRLEPNQQVEKATLKAMGLTPTKAIQPQETLLIDLSQDEASLRQQISSRRRGYINAAPRKGVEIKQSTDPDDVGVFLSLLKATSEHDQFNTHSDNYYEILLKTLLSTEKAALYLAFQEQQPLGAVITFVDQTTVYYAHAAADQKQSLKLGAPAFLVWQIMLDAKKAGKKRFDFWGIAPTEDSNHPWAGFSKFKRSFGGKMQSRSGTWDLPVSPWKYRGYRLARKLLP